MPRPLERDKPMTRINVMLDRDSLEKAQRKAALAGVDPFIAGNSSAFIRWLIDNFNNQVIAGDIKQNIQKLLTRKPKPIPKAQFDKWITKKAKNNGIAK